MARFKRLFVAAGVLLLIAFALGVYNVVGRSLIEAREATCSDEPGLDREEGRGISRDPPGDIP